MRQYRLPADQYLWELPAGKIDEGENALQAAKRELVEETGLRAKKWKKLAFFYPSPGLCGRDDDDLSRDRTHARRGAADGR